MGLERWDAGARFGATAHGTLWGKLRALGGDNNCFSSKNAKMSGGKGPISSKNAKIGGETGVIFGGCGRQCDGSGSGGVFVEGIFELVWILVAFFGDLRYLIIT